MILNVNIFESTSYQHKQTRINMGVNMYYNTKSNDSENGDYNCHKCKHLRVMKGFGKYRIIYYCNHSGAEGFLNEEFLPHPHWCPLWKKHIQDEISRIFEKRRRSDVKK